MHRNRAVDLQRPFKLQDMRRFTGVHQAGDRSLECGIDHAASARVGRVENDLIERSWNADILPIVRNAPTVVATWQGAAPDVAGGGCRVGANLEGSPFFRRADGHAGATAAPDRAF